MIDVNRLAPLMSSKVVGDTPEDAENFKATSTNFANLQVSSTTREFIAADEDYEYCPNCSRKFFAGRLRLHLKSCKDGKPLKPLKSKPVNEQVVREETALNKTADEVMSYRVPSHQRIDQNASFGANNGEAVQEKSPQVGSIKMTRSPLKEKLNEEQWAENEPAEYEASNNIARGEFIDDGIERTRAEDGRLGCVVCGRFFMEERIQQHEKACKKSQKKRAVFDTTKQRAIADQDGMVPKPVEKSKVKKLVSPVKGKDEEKADVVVPVSSKKEEKSAKKLPAWKVEHENFIKNIRFNRQLKDMEARGEDTSGLVAPTIVNENYVGCPHCSRKFAPATADRHIPKCKNTFNRPKPPKSLQLEKLDEGQKGDRTKAKFMIKKGPHLRMSPSHAGGAGGGDPKSPMTPTPGGQDRNSSYRSPGSNFSTANYETQVDEAMRSKASPKESAKRATQSGPMRADSKVGIKKLGSLDTKQAIMLDQKTYETSEMSPNSHEIKLPEKKTRDFRSQSPSGAGGRDGKKVFTEAIPKKDELLQNYQNIFDRSASYSTNQCPHCARKFSHHAAERHIPVCKSIKARPLRRDEQEAVAADKTKTKMYLTGLGTKANFKVKAEGKEEEGQAKSSHNGAYSTEYEHFFARVQSKNGDKPPLPFKKPLYGGGESNAVIPERLSTLQKAKLGSASASHFCTGCGLKMMKSHKFCGSCGSKKLI